LSGVSVTISGASGVGVAQGIGVGRPKADGSTVIMTPSGTVTGTGVVDAVKAVGTGVADGLGAVGKGVADVFGLPSGFEATRSPPGTSTIQQQ
jgi:hypothetical protein